MKNNRIGRRRLSRFGSALLLIAVAGLLGGCAIGVDSWDRDLMAKKSMQLNPNPLLTDADDHIYFSKEGSSGGRSFDGGGCGCN